MKDKRLAQVFKNAIPHLSPTTLNGDWDKSQFICCAISKGNPASPLVSKAKSIIDKRLAGHLVFENWLKERIGRTAVRKDYRTNAGRKLQATRLAWLNSLVEEFS